jgi:outer membrane lipoprotein-sorting protein
MTSLQPPELRDFPAERLARRRQHLLAEIAEQPAGRRALRHVAPRRLGLALAAAAVVAVALVAVLVTKSGTTEASAAMVRARITQGLSVPRSIRGEFTVESRPAQPHRQTHGCANCKPPLPVASTFVLGADGSFGSHALAPTPTFPAGVAYDAGADVMTMLGTLGSSVFYVRATGNNPASTGFRPEHELATWVLHALGSGDAHVTETALGGRDAWALTLEFTPGDDYYDTYGARVDVIVDRETGLLLKLTQYANDPAYWTSIETIRNLQLDTPTSPRDFAVAVPPHVKVIDYDYGFERATPAEAAAIVGYEPFLPTNTGGRSLDQLAAAKRSQLAFLPGIEAPIFRAAITARYGSGLDAVTVSTRRGKPLDIVPELTAKTIEISRGPLAGTSAYLSTSPTVPGYLTAYYDGLVIEIDAPSAREALAAAESLRAG